MEIYQPAEDSYLLQETLKQYLKNKPPSLSILDMGSGSGIQAKTCLDLGFSNVLAVDINNTAITCLKKQNIKTTKSDLFSNVNGKYNLVIFNSPYLPEHKYDKKADTTGGKKGYETIIKFLRQALTHLNKDGEILLLFSSLSSPDIILKKAENLGYSYRLLNKKRLPLFEELFVYKFRQ